MNRTHNIHFWQFSVACAMSAVFAFTAGSMAAAAEHPADAKRGKADNLSASAAKATRLCLELVKTEPIPIIGPLHPDAKDIPAGFGAGTTVKITIRGKSAYHMVSTTMETFGATRWAYMRTEHWISEDGATWRRHMILFRPGSAGPAPIFRWNRFCLPACSDRCNF